MTTNTTMCYVAADPSQPGAAWAAMVDMPDHQKDTAKEIASWVRQGAHVMRIDTDTARQMLSKWVRPEKKKTSSVAADLFAGDAA